MPTAWFIFVFWFVVWRIVRAESPPSAIEFFAIAVLVGLTATAVATVLTIVPLLLTALFLNSKKQAAFSSNLVIKFCAVIAGVAIGTSPCWIHNCFVAKDPVFLSAHSGINFWIGNNPEANGYPRFPPGLRAGQAAMLQDSVSQAEAATGRHLKHGEVSNYWSNKARSYIRDDFGDWLHLVGTKIRNLCSAFQYDDLSIITSLREQGVILPGLYFGIVAAFALPGVFVAWRLAPQSRWVVAAIVLAVLSLLSVFITERYRLIAVPGLLMFAAFGLLVFWQSLVANQIRVGAAYVLVVAGAAAIISWPQQNPSLWALDAYNSGWQALESNNLPLAESKLAMAHAYVPENSETLFALGNLRLAESNPTGAEAFYRAVLDTDSKHKGAFNNLGVIALEAGKYNEAENWLRRAEEIDPRSAKTHFLLAKALLAQNNRSSAETEIETAIALSPGQSEFVILKQQINEQ